MINLNDTLTQFQWKYQIIFCKNEDNFLISSVGIGLQDIIVGKISDTKKFLNYHVTILKNKEIPYLLESDKSLEFPGAIIITKDDDNSFNILENLDELSNKIKSNILIYIESGLSDKDVYLEFTRCIHENSAHLQQLISRDYINLVDLLAKDSEISDIEAAAYKILKNPMIITDESYKVMSYTKDIEIDDPIWKTIVGNTYCPSSLVERTDYNKFWERLNKNGKPLFVDSKDFSPYVRRAVAQIKSEDSIKGYIALLEINKKIISNNLEILQMTAETIAAKITSQNKVSKALGELKREFVMELLLGKIANETMAYNQAVSLGWDTKKYFSVLEVIDSKDSYIEKKAAYICSELKKLFSFCVYTCSSNKAYFILSFEDKKELNKSTFSGIEKIMKNEDLTAYAGGIVDSLVSLFKSFDEAKSASEIISIIDGKLEEKSLYLYKDIAIYDMVLKLIKNKEFPLVKNKTLALLKEIDKKEDSEYLITLRRFLENNQDITSTANSLYLHRNTIKYRLNKIAELMEDDFHNPLVRLHIHMSFIIDDLTSNS